MEKFRIPTIPPTTNKTIRFPNNVIEEIEETIVGLDSNFSAFVVGAVRWALDNIGEGETMPFYGKEWSRRKEDKTLSETGRKADMQDESFPGRNMNAGLTADTEENADNEEKPGQKGL